MNAIEHYLRFTDWLNAKFAWIVAFLMVPMLAIMIWEIVLRYFFNSPSLWAYEISMFLYGAYIVLGAGFGLSPEMALAVSLLKRGRDLATGLAIVAIWQTIEARRLWQRRGVAPSA